MMTIGKWISFAGVIATAIWVGFDLGSKQAAYSSFSTLLVVLGGFLLASKAAAQPDYGHPNDVALFKEFLELLPPDGVGRSLRVHDFGNDFPREYASAIHAFANSWNSPDKHFVDANLEMSRRRLFEDGGKLSQEIALRTVPDVSGSQVTTWPGRRTEMMRSEHVWSDIRMLNKAAAEFSDTYDKFVEFARSKLILATHKQL